MAVIVEKTSNIASAPETVWGLLVNLESWKRWWPDCVEAHTMDYRTLREGSKIELVVQPKHRKHTLNPVVDMISEGRRLSLTYESPVLRGTAVWTVGEGPSGTRVHLRAVFKGFQVWVMGLASKNDIFQLGLHSNLRGLKKLAERMI